MRYGNAGAAGGTGVGDGVGVEVGTGVGVEVGWLVVVVVVVGLLVVVVVVAGLLVGVPCGVVDVVVGFGVVVATGLVADGDGEFVAEDVGSVGCPVICPVVSPAVGSMVGSEVGSVGPEVCSVVVVLSPGEGVAGSVDSTVDGDNDSVIGVGTT